MPAPGGGVRWDISAGATFVKICGITRLGDARAAVRAGANALGFVFAPSPRRVTPSRARQIAPHLHPSVASVGVFVDASEEEILGVVAEVGLDGVQLQGGEGPEVVEALRRRRPGLFIAKAVRILEPGDLARTLRWPADAVFVDSKDPADPGAPGRPIPAAWLEGPRPRRLVVAGGLTPGNVAAVVAGLRPWGVDVSGGVETSPGKKDPALLRDFVRAVRTARPGPLPALR
jgi:phosphoribosylanthranilate isomerase